MVIALLLHCFHIPLYFLRRFVLFLSTSSKHLIAIFSNNRNLSIVQENHILSMRQQSRRIGSNKVTITTHPKHNRATHPSNYYLTRILIAHHSNTIGTTHPLQSFLHRLSQITGVKWAH